MPYSEKTKRRDYAREWMARRRAELIARLGGRCAECGSTERLELDHVDRRQKVTHHIVSWRRARQDVEAAKCQILCHRCHGEKTCAEHSRPIPHGTRQGYRRGCRCAQCTEVASAANKRLRLRCSHGDNQCRRCRFELTCSAQAAHESAAAPARARR